MTTEIGKQRALIARLHHDLYQAKIHGESLAKIEKTPPEDGGGGKETESDAFCGIAEGRLTWKKSLILS